MQLEDMILVSIDDHFIQPPDIFAKHVPKKWLDDVPKVVGNHEGVNDWVIDEWCAAYPVRFIPLGIVPMWDVDLAVDEIHRIAQKGCRSVSFLETPHVQGYPSFLSGYWDPMLQALCEENMVLSLHIG